MIAENGRLRFTDAASAETLSRLIQSVPSPKAESKDGWLRFKKEQVGRLLYLTFLGMFPAKM